VTALNDPEHVREQYASEANLRARQAIYANREGPDPREVLFQTIAALEPRRILEVGGGPGELSERMMRDLDADVRFVDISPRMVELARTRGIDAQVGDVQALPFADASFDVAVAAWMLYHVPDLDRGLAELRRVLVPGGRLVAVVNSETHLRELRELFARAFDLNITRENGAELLARHFASVEQHDVDGWTSIPDRAAVIAYANSGLSARRDVDPDFDVPLRVRVAPTVFVATK
jgi:SAM-dependent methyltransferase